jgi:uridine kinase
MAEPVRYADLAAAVLDGPARLGAVRLVAIDGPSGAGKTVVAEALAAALRRRTGPVTVVHTDDLLDGWDDQFTFWPRLEAQVLGPLRAGRPGSYRRYDWVAQSFREEAVPVPARGVVIVEGVSSARAVIRPELTLSVFVTAAPDVRLARSLARDGDAMQLRLRTWREREVEFFAADGTLATADRVVDGTAPPR